uniref:riboflavin kinase n=1 Tax=Syphacia muris TaxID=451379 RepID=A0A0N5AW73_9BILA
MAPELLPYFFEGTVVSGFGRGSRELGCPTANLDEKAVSQLPSTFPNGVFYGLAKVDDGLIYRMVMSVGWNPQYKNEKRTIEVHILHSFSEDFYGSRIRCVALGYLREMTTFSSIDELKTAITTDIYAAKSHMKEVNTETFDLDSHFGNK